MFLIASQDTGPTHYLLELDNYIDESIWIYSEQTKHLLRDKHCVEYWDHLEPALIVTGTTLGKSIDKELISFAKTICKPSVSIIEHWSNYNKRFNLNGKMILPDHIIVNDNYAKYQAIQDDLPADKLFVGGNPHLEKLAKTKLNRVKTNEWKMKNKIPDGKLIIFIAESIKDSFGTDYFGYDEFTVLNSLIDILPEDSVLLIKKHPEESKDKYNTFLSDRVKVIDDCNIDVMIQVAYIIIGMASMLLIELGMFRDDIISYRPNYRKPFIGEEIHATHLAHTEKHCINFIKHPPKSSSLSFRHSFEGSAIRISNYLNSLT